MTPMDLFISIIALSLEGEIPTRKLQREHVIECGLDEWFSVWLLAPFGKLEKDVEDAYRAVSSAVIVRAVEIVLKNTARDKDRLYCCTPMWRGVWGEGREGGACLCNVTFDYIS